MLALTTSGKLGMLGISALALVAALRIPPTTPNGRAGVQRPADHPVAAFAWARTNCDAQLSIKLGSHLEHAEVLMRVGAELDQARATKSLADVCRYAIAAAEPALGREPYPAMLPTLSRRRPGPTTDISSAYSKVLDR